MHLRLHAVLFRLARVAPFVVAASIVAACGGGGSTAPLNVPAGHRAGESIRAATAAAFGVADAGSAWTYAAPLSLRWPKGAPGSGDVLVACAEANVGNTPVTPPGWTALYATSANRKGTALFYRVAGPAEPVAVTFATPHPFNIAVAMMRITGAAATAPLWSHATSSGTVTSIATPAIVPNVPGMLPVACFSGVNAGGYAVAGGWMTDSAETRYYPATIAHRAALAPDTATPIGVTATIATPLQYAVNDAYGILVAPAAASTGGVTATPASLAFTAVSAPAQSLTVAQSGTTSFTAATRDCGSVASINATGPGAFSVTPLGVGSCSFTITGSAGASVVVPVTTTSTSIVVH